MWAIRVVFRVNPLLQTLQMNFEGFFCFVTFGDELMRPDEHGMLDIDDCCIFADSSLIDYCNLRKLL